MSRRIYIIAKDTPVDDTIIQAAGDNGCTEIVVGIPPALEKELEVQKLPYVHVEPEPPVPIQSRDLAKEVDELKAKIATMGVVKAII